MSDIRTITARELKQQLEGETTVKVVETLSREDFAKGHIPGAVNLPVADIEREAPDALSKDDKIIVYCANTECSASGKAARKLVEMGYPNVTDFEAGKEGWKAEGYELVA